MNFGIYELLELDNLELTEDEKYIIYLKEKRLHDNANFYASGVEDGKTEVIKNMIKNMLKNNMDINLICSIVNVDRDFVLKIKNN